ncbi:hypothetical protein K6T82_08425 [Flavobacterium sp. 17A]|uniref:Uncharacterized protein n=1 Tax=Flavobacterium potami TaxID=2872310 RepID=A0A9X1HA92_9FLAO|nr:hypothetical protein [Flavobacterium potami]MBZ4034789.1 hypothetical protein [Flavobacterium potami]
MKPNLFFTFLLFIGFNLYSQKSEIEFFYVENYKNSNSDCKYCFDLEKAKLSSVPLLNEKDIKHFNWQTQQIILTEKGKHKFTDLKIPLSGLPVVLTLNGRKIYGLWFWNAVSSFGCDRVYTFPTIDFKIRFGLPKNYRFGTDPRFDKKLKEYVLSKYNQ